jgi:hypothetical protein
MFGLFIGTLCLFLLIGTIRHRRYAYGYGAFGHGWGHHHGHQHYGYPPWGFRHARRRFLIRSLFEQLDTTPGQEKAIVKTIGTLTEHMANSREELQEVRKQVAQALGGDVLDESILTAALDRVEGLIRKAKVELAEALQEVHGSLDGTQRRQLAELIAEGLPHPGFRYGRF